MNLGAVNILKMEIPTAATETVITPTDKYYFAPMSNNVDHTFDSNDKNLPFKILEPGTYMPNKVGLVPVDLNTMLLRFITHQIDAFPVNLVSFKSSGAFAGAMTVMFHEHDITNVFTNKYVFVNHGVVHLLEKSRVKVAIMLNGVKCTIKEVKNKYITYETLHVDQADNVDNFKKLMKL